MVYMTLYRRCINLYAMHKKLSYFNDPGLCLSYWPKRPIRSSHFSLILTLEVSYKNMSCLMRLWTTWTWKEHVFLPIYQFVQSPKSRFLRYHALNLAFWTSDLYEMKIYIKYLHTSVHYKNLAMQCNAKKGVHETLTSTSMHQSTHCLEFFHIYQV